MPDNDLQTLARNLYGTYNGELNTDSIVSKYKPNPNHWKYLEGFNESFNEGFGDIPYIRRNQSSLGVVTGNALSSVGSLIGNKNGNDFSSGQKSSQSAIRSAIGTIPGYGQIIAAATGLVDAIGTVTDTNLSNIDRNSAKRAGIGGTAILNDAINHLPGVSMFFGLAGNTTNNFTASDEAKDMYAGYTGLSRDLRAAEDIGNKRLLFGNEQASDFLRKAYSDDKILRQINETNTMRKRSDYYQDLANQNINRYAGQNYLNTRVGKSGFKLMSIKDVKEILLKRQETKKLQNGGEIPGIDTSILPEGALHAHKNNLAELNPDLEDATKKGIPVMAAEGGETPVIKEQVAEIESDEIIFRLDITKQLEELRKDGSEEAMITAGKLIAEEIIENTQDNTGQITEEVTDGK